MIGVLFFWKGLTVLVPLETGIPALVFRFIRYALMTLWVTYLAPQLFLRLHLSEVVTGAPDSPKEGH
jgi:hypothetical protein